MQQICVLKNLALEGKEEKKLFYFTYEKWPKSTFVIVQINNTIQVGN